jgi:hypothetical protein
MSGPQIRLIVAATSKGNLTSIPAAQLKVFQIKQLCDQKLKRCSLAASNGELFSGHYVFSARSSSTGTQENFDGMTGFRLGSVIEMQKRSK